MIGVAGRDELETFTSWVDEHGVAGFDHLADLDGSIWREFGITSQPAFAFINDDGTTESRRGAMGVEALTERITELISA